MRANERLSTRVSVRGESREASAGAARGAEPAKQPNSLAAARRRGFPQAAENDPAVVENRGLAGLGARPRVRAAVTRHADGRYQLALYPLDGEGSRIRGLGVAGVYSTLGAAMAAAYGHAWQAGAALQGIGLGTVYSGA
jgi:hypothetical protein